ncbi:ankyrin repeat domain-containing protein [Niveispirillum irakense]|uniref:ankyrin repeat domain-containing protein n=1 Tax=Niveispirillum irakense TaxID=34011 RepID=UPI00048DB0AC|nr:ankyrin repeat domain-containing protein [Niveispirillum irakense]
MSMRFFIILVFLFSPFIAYQIFSSDRSMIMNVVADTYPDYFEDTDAFVFAKAVARGDVSAALAAALRLPEGVNTVGREGVTALWLAADRYDYRMVKALLNAGADPDGGKGLPPLAKAAALEDIQMVKIFLGHGANPNKKKNTKPIIYTASMTGNIDIVNLLLLNGADIEAEDGVGTTPILSAAMLDRWQLVLFLMDRGASVWPASGGITVGLLAANSRILPSHPDGAVLPQVIERLKAKGFPWPPPKASEVRAMIERGQWPPPGAR